MKFEQKDLEDLTDALVKVGLLADGVSKLARRARNPLPAAKLKGHRGLYIEVSALTQWALTELGVGDFTQESNAEFATGYKPRSDAELAAEDDLPGHKG